MRNPLPFGLPAMRGSFVVLASALFCTLCAATPLQVSVLDKDGQPVVDAVVVVVTASKAAPTRPLPKEVTISQESASCRP
jgi:hypothetical protein